MDIKEVFLKLPIIGTEVYDEETKLIFTKIQKLVDHILKQYWKVYVKNDVPDTEVIDVSD